MRLWPLLLLTQLLLATTETNASATDSSSCTDALKRVCPDGPGEHACDVTCGHHQHDLKLAGCTAAAIRTYCASSSPPCVVWVSETRGSDANGGASPAVPLATITAALEAKNELRRQAPDEHCTMFVAGTHELRTTLQLWAIDGHTTLSPWPAGAAGETLTQPLISGGAAVPAAAWKRNFAGGWQADISPLLASAGIDPSSAWRVRTPILHWSAPLANDTSQAGKGASRWGFVYSAGDIGADWDVSPSALRLWRVVCFHQWTKSYHTVKAVFPANRTILFAQPAPFYYGQFVKNTASGKRYYIEGAKEIPLTRGDDAFRLTRALLEYPDYDPTVVVTVPLLQRVLSVNHAANVTLSGLRLAHSTIQCPALDQTDDGYTTCDDEFTGPSAKGVATKGVGELLFANNASGLVLRNLSAGSSGGNALSVVNSPHVVVERALVTDAGGVGIEVADSFEGAILNSRVVGAGMVIQNLPGITIHDSPYGRVSRCEVTAVAHCRGIRFDSTADAGRYTNVSWNHIHHCGCGGDECLSDGGGLDGMNTGSKLPIYLEHNWVHDIDAHHFGGAGIYADVSSNAMHITSNVVHDVADQVLYWNVQPSGKVPLLLDAMPFFVKNNILVKNRMNQGNDAPWQLHATPIITWKGFTPATFEGNIIYVNLTASRFSYRGGPLLATTACAQQFKVPANATCGASPLDNFRGGSWDSNVYFNTSDLEETALREKGFCGFSLARWQGAGHGARSVVADPQFVDGDSGDFRLRAGSPALARGFVQWDYKSVGPDWY